MWKAIELPGDLPPLESAERVDLDFKAEHNHDSFEHAKDVAAFANAIGGSILIGGAGNDRVKVWKPLTADDAKRCRRSYEEAVRDRCMPRPILSANEIAFDGGYIVAVNVRPFLGQPVAVRLTKAEAPSCELALYFPMRVGTQTKAITPEQLPMLFDARTRRVALLLEQAIGERVVIAPLTSPLIDRSTSELVAVDLLRNAVRFGDGAKEMSFTVPLDMIETVYNAGPAWYVLVRGVVRDHEPQPGSAPELALQRIFLPQ